MAVASGGQQRFIFNRESSFGTKATGGGSTPGTDQYWTFRATRGSVRNAVRAVESQLIRGDRQGAGTQPVFFASEGSLQTELIAGDAAHDELFSRGLYSSFNKADNIGATDGSKGANATDNTDTLTPTGTGVDLTTGNWATLGAQVGCWVGISEFAGNTAVEGWWKVTGVSGQSLTLDTGSGKGLGFDGATRTWPGVVAGEVAAYAFAFCRNYTTKKGLTVERGFLDENEYLQTLGTVVSRMSMNLASEQIATATFELLGTDYATDTASAETGTPATAGTNVPIAASTDVSLIYKDGATLADVRRIEFSLDNRISQLSEIGTSTAADVTAGTFAITGTLEAYFSDKTVLEDLVKAQTEFAIEVVFVDPAGNLFAVNIPAANLTGGGVDESGSDDPVVATYPFGARLKADGSATYLMQIDSVAKPT